MLLLVAYGVDVDVVVVVVGDRRVVGDVVVEVVDVVVVVVVEL